LSIEITGRETESRAENGKKRIRIWEGRIEEKRKRMNERRRKEHAI